MITMEAESQFHAASPVNIPVDFEKLKSSGALPSPQGVGLAVMRICQRETVPLQELVRVIQADPVLAGRIIKVANSVNPVKNRSIASVSLEVLILIGVQSVREVVLGLSLMTAYRSGRCENFDYQRFWIYSLAMACAAQEIARSVRVAPPSEMFTCGLLAGVGRLGLASAYPEPYSQLLAEADNQVAIEMDSEMQVFGFHRNMLSSAMMADWKIPQIFCDGVLFHENPESSGLTEQTRLGKILYVLHMSSMVAEAVVSGGASSGVWNASLFDIAEKLAIDTEEVTAIVSKSLQEWTDWANILQLQTFWPMPTETK